MAEPIISPHVSLMKSMPKGKTIITIVIVLFLLWSLYSHWLMRLYASILFLLYAATHSLWISILMLGLLIAIAIIPLRSMNLSKQKHTHDFADTIAKNKSKEAESFLILKTAKPKHHPLSYYLIDFVIFVTGFLGLRRLFHTDFYTTPISPDLLYSFVPIPTYPLNDLIFKIPYVKIPTSQDFGWPMVLIIWVIIGVILFFIAKIIRKRREKSAPNSPPISTTLTRSMRVLPSSLLLLFFLSYYLVKHFPTSMALGIFSADVSQPYLPLSLILVGLAIITTLILDIPSIVKKGELAETKHFSDDIIRQTQTELLTSSLRTAVLVSIVIYLTTRHDPAAFGLCLLAILVLSWIYPLTIDRIILKSPQSLPSEKVSTHVQSA